MKPEPEPAPRPVPAGRIAGVDRLRGLAIVLMALDHVSFFILRVHYAEYWGAPFPGYPSFVAFATRSLSHICAPAFFFLMGASISLATARRALGGWSGLRIDGRLALRGLALMAADTLVFSPLWASGSARGVAGASNMPGSGPMASPLLFGVLFALGLCMALAPLIRKLPSTILALGGAASIVLSFWLVASIQMSAANQALASRLVLLPGRSGSFIVLYPLFPWIGIAALGIAFGKFLHAAPARAYAWAFRIGLGMLAAFVLLSFGFGFGDFHEPLMEGFQARLTLTKYPPSLAYLLLYLGMSLVLLAMLEKVGGRAGAFLEAFGRAPFFFYALHLCAYWAIGGMLLPLRVSYFWAYASWILSIAAFFPICRAYGTWKGRQAPSSILRFL